jgi:hypothetical protein
MPVCLSQASGSAGSSCGRRHDGIEPAETETYDNGVRKATYRDADGNEIGIGGGPSEAT